MTFEEMSQLLEEFELANVDFFHTEAFIGSTLLLGEDGNPSSFEIAWDQDSLGEREIPYAEAQLSLVKWEGNVLGVTQVRTSMPRVQNASHPFHVGTRARGRGLGGYGTAGVFFTLDGSDLLVLSNHHVFCTQGNQTQFGHRVELASASNDGFGSFEDVGSLVAYERVEKQGWNLWDVAFARADQPHRFLSSFPRFYGINANLRFANPNEPLKPGVFETGGARPPHKGTGCLEGLGNTNVRWVDGTVRLFRNQLRFSKMTDPGDSGSVIYSTDTAQPLIFGLGFAGSDRHSWANPIYQYNWTYKGTRVLDGGMEVPAFDLPKVEELIAKSEMKSIVPEHTFDGFGVEAAETGVLPNPSSPVPSLIYRGRLTIVALDQLRRGRLVVVGTWGSNRNWLKVKWQGPSNPFPNYIIGWVNVNSPENIYQVETGVGGV